MLRYIFDKRYIEDKMKHTPGKWKSNEGSSSKNIPILGTGSREFMVIAEVYQENGTEEAQANARLIASAPELLEASKLARDYLRFNQGNASPIFDKLEQAIAKAEGKE